MLQSLLFADVEAVRALLSGARGLQVGDSGNGVKAVQFALDALGYQLPTSVSASPLAADGLFGPETLGAVKAFQRRNNLAADGIVGRFTIAALDGALMDGGADPLRARIDTLSEALEKAGRCALAEQRNYAERAIGVALSEVDTLAALGNPLRMLARMNQLARVSAFS